MSDEDTEGMEPAAEGETPPVDAAEKSNVDESAVCPPADNDELAKLLKTSTVVLTTGLLAQISSNPVAPCVI